MTVILDRFAYRHWDEDTKVSPKLNDISKEDFIEEVRRYIEQQGGFDKCSVSGYAPFCRHVFMPNMTMAKVDSIKITPEIQPVIKSGYVSRRPEELAVLARWIEAKDVPGGVPRAEVLDLIFYSHEQLIKEAEAMNETTQPGDWAWGLISVKAQNRNAEIPMQPITAMRNALGVEYGGSSVPIDPVEYKKSVDYWQEYISIQ